MIIPPLLHRITAAQPYPLLFATISGAHVLPLPRALGLRSEIEWTASYDHRVTVLEIR